MPPKIRNGQEYQEALDRVDELMDINPDPKSMDGYELDSLAEMIEDYEDLHFPWTMGIDEYDYLD